MSAAFKLFDGMSSPQEEKPAMWHNVSIPAWSVHGVVCGSLVVASRHCENPTSLETSISTTSRMHIKCLLICPKTSTYNNTGSDLLDACVFYCGKTPKGKNIILVIAWTKFFSCAYWCVQLKADIGKLQAHDNTCWLEVMIAERISGWVNEFHWLGSKCCNTSLDCPMFISLEVMKNSLVILPIQTNENDQEAVWSGTSVLKIMPLPSWVKLEVESIQLQQPWPPPRQSCKQQFQGNNGYALVVCFNKFQNASEEINKCRRRFIQADDGLDTTQPLESGSLKATYGHRGLIRVIFVEGILHNTLTCRPGGGSNQMVTLNMLASEVCVPVKFETDTAECGQTRLSVGQFIYKAAIFPLVSSMCSVLISGHDLLAQQKPHDHFACWDPGGVVLQLISKTAWSVSWIQLQTPFPTKLYQGSSCGFGCRCSVIASSVIIQQSLLKKIIVKDTSSQVGKYRHSVCVEMIGFLCALAYGLQQDAKGCTVLQQAVSAGSLFATIQCKMRTSILPWNGPALHRTRSNHGAVLWIGLRHISISANDTTTDCTFFTARSLAKGIQWCFQFHAADKSYSDFAHLNELPCTLAYVLLQGALDYQLNVEPTNTWVISCGAMCFQEQLCFTQRISEEVQYTLRKYLSWQWCYHLSKPTASTKRDELGVNSKQFIWDPGGVNNSGLGASRISSGGECQVQADKWANWRCCKVGPTNDVVLDNIKETRGQRDVASNRIRRTQTRLPPLSRTCSTAVLAPVS